MKKLNSQYGETCTFCGKGKISVRFIKEASGCCYECVSNIPKNIHIEDRLNYLIRKLNRNENQK